MKYALTLVSILFASTAYGDDAVTFGRTDGYIAMFVAPTASDYVMDKKYQDIEITIDEQVITLHLGNGAKLCGDIAVFKGPAHKVGGDYKAFFKVGGNAQYCAVRVD